jgi:hypothetical protein
LNSKNIFQRSKEFKNIFKTYFKLFIIVDQMMNKRDEIQALIETHQPAVMGITEVKPKNNRFTIEKCEVAYKGYEIFLNLGKLGRGIALYVKSVSVPSACDSLDSDFA